MAEFVMKDMVQKAGAADDFFIASAATSTEEIGNPVHHGTRSRLAREGISVAGKYARQMTQRDYEEYDYLIGMDHWNLRNMQRITGPDTDNKLSLLLDYTDRVGADIADPWYTGNFEETYNDIVEGCTALLRNLGYEIGLRM